MDFNCKYIFSISEIAAALRIERIRELGGKNSIYNDAIMLSCMRCMCNCNQNFLCHCLYVTMVTAHILNWL